MTQQPRFGLNKEARLAAERKEQAVPTALLELDPRFPYTLLPAPVLLDFEPSDKVVAQQP